MTDPQPNDPADLPEVIKITSDEVARAMPPPPRFQQVMPPAREPSVRTSKLAVASLAMGIAGLPLTCLFGFLAVAAGVAAAVSLHWNAHLRGMKLAVAGMALGVVSLVGWPIALYHALKGRVIPTEAPPVGLTDIGGIPTEEIHNAREPYRTALLANVVVMGSAVGASWSGSGIVIDREDDVIRVLTNRHVAEPPGGARECELKLQLATVAEHVAATAVWKAPGGLDLSILEARVPAMAALPVIAVKRMAPGIGDRVFAVGNPLQFRWSLTTGTISSVRTVDMGGERARVYQTQTPISSGNSGGGLYTEDGTLVGVNTWTADKATSEGLGFSISIDTFLDVLARSAPAWSRRLAEK